MQRRDKRDSKVSWSASQRRVTKRTVPYRPAACLDPLVESMLGLCHMYILSQSAERAAHERHPMASRKEQLSSLFFVAWTTQPLHEKLLMGFRRAFFLAYRCRTDGFVRHWLFLVGTLHKNQESANGRSQGKLPQCKTTSRAIEKETKKKRCSLQRQTENSSLDLRIQSPSPFRGKGWRELFIHFRMASIPEFVGPSQGGSFCVFAEAALAKLFLRYPTHHSQRELAIVESRYDLD